MKKNEEYKGNTVRENKIKREKTKVKVDKYIKKQRENKEKEKNLNR